MTKAPEGARRGGAPRVCAGRLGDPAASRGWRSLGRAGRGAARGGLPSRLALHVLTRTSERQRCADERACGSRLVGWVILPPRRITSASALSLGSGSISFSKFIFLHKSLWLLWD